LLGGCGRASSSEACATDGKYVFLVAGLDDAAENTDVLFCIGIDPTLGTVNVCQIPRDTYYNFGKSQNKINQVFSSARSAGASEDVAMNALKGELSQSLGANFDGYIALKLDGFLKLVDALGGVEITLSSPMNIEIDGMEPIHLVAGVNHIDSKKAEGFVRYRQGYVTQDLGRIDAQKIFINAIFYKLSKASSLPVLLKLAKVMQENSLTDVKFSQLVGLLFSGGTRIKESRFVTLAGEALTSREGISYYALNKSASEEIVGNYLFSFGGFDKNSKFLNQNEEDFLKIYRMENFKYKEYTNETLKDLSLSNR
jgi:LCP family protein required for cell wall assembly